MASLEYQVHQLPLAEIRKSGLIFLEQAYASSEFKEKAVRLEDLIYNRAEDYISEIILWGLHLSQTTFSGYYSEKINTILRGDFCNLPDSTKPNIFPELYQNPLLSNEEQEDLKELHQLEIVAMREAFTLGQYCDNPLFFRNIADWEREDLQCIDLFSQCFNRLLSETEPRPSYSCPIQSLWVIEKTGDYQSPTAFFKLDLKELLHAILTNKINAETSLTFHPETINKVRKRFPKELKLVQYTLSQ